MSHKNNHQQKEKNMERPAQLQEEHLDFLDDLRESGETNMFGARPFLMEGYPDLTTVEAGAICGYWMKTFSERHPKVPS